MAPLLLLLLFSACAQAPAAVPEEAPASPVRLEVAKREAFQPELVVLGTVQPGGTAEVTVPASGRSPQSAAIIAPAPRPPHPPAGTTARSAAGV
jgi:multidrug efflux pump subunit AcrA (membrane-fusion protein)